MAFSSIIDMINRSSSSEKSTTCERLLFKLCNIFKSTEFLYTQISTFHPPFKIQTINGGYPAGIFIFIRRHVKFFGISYLLK